ncbi:FKBP-type peptidyl-prolyl cis-trans isomerase [Tenacibaculum finnmarkense]|uniref:FKBP-type peptidyl-prolyl cis-trans isomerase n=1 Tax=Tenacibaculum finnmarkense TaxID=2781243 RepID=UPI001E5C706C|nr:FKBP-type peptidyl-prolyl cis-trans isomerase [Tenacibaculum finnmarkense]MCD8453016.1 FKBP-type peptidyl-prolyl cis-trans isomerase [Tenacibaculum finnmarkense genomovar ulcerans]MCG8207443.1 FKBP-type peptidyl-prolyl cis-trans isomerase [Tenacibaculum finnmarkense genomovar finnmarkense]MCG8723554.1 peptidylprolyl isomerase [Tenacibaculum finnmarkense]MCG8765246.1 peptidylprolyl isomerase [Tenacibaculum finnmarkense]MCG8778064.1 peptidylprolyl isomerase [Tenacibaculum finnmarkense]
MKKIVCLLTLIASFFSCGSSSSNDVRDFDAQNQADIIKYIADNNLKATKTPSGLYYVVNKEGSGAKPVSNSQVTVAYKGYFLNGNVFDQNSNGISFNLQQVIAGWTEGITYFKEGGEGMLLVPSKLGYGSQNRSRIPGGSVLIFDIKLLKVK